MIPHNWNNNFKDELHVTEASCVGLKWLSFCIVPDRQLCCLAWAHCWPGDHYCIRVAGFNSAARAHGR